MGYPAFLRRSRETVVILAGDERKKKKNEKHEEYQEHNTNRSRQRCKVFRTEILIRAGSEHRRKDVIRASLFAQFLPFSNGTKTLCHTRQPAEDRARTAIKK